MRRSRKVKILATIGPASSDEDMLKKLFEAGADVFRINMSHTDHDTDAHAGRRASARWKRRSAARSASSPICRDRSCASASSPTARSTLTLGQTFTLDDNPAPGDANARATCRIRKSCDRSRPGDRLLIDDGKLELKAVTSDGKSIVCTVRRRHHDLRQEGRQPARHRPAGRRADRKGPHGPRRGARDRRRLGGAVLHPAPGRPRRGAQDRARPGAADVEDREAAGGGAAGRDHRALRRADGGARRPRRRDAARSGARHPEADHPRRAPRRQAGGGRDADAGIDDHRAGADPRRGVRRVDRRLRGRRRHHAVGRIGGRRSIRSKRWRR